MKIVLIGPYKPTIGGVASHIFNLRERLLAEGHSVKVIDVITTKKIEQQENILNVNRNPLKLLWSVSKLLILGYKIFHFNVSQKGTYITLVIPLLKFFGAKYLITFHSGSVLCFFEECSLFEGLTTKLNCRFATRILFVDKSVSRAFTQKYGYKKVSSYDSFIRQENVSGEKRVYLVDNVLSVICTGLWQPYYRYADCMTALDNIDAKGLTVKLVLMVGRFNENIEYKGNILSLVDKYSNYEISIQEDVENPYALYSKSDLLIRTSSVDSYGLSIAEAISVGTVGVATNVCERPVGTITYESGDIEELVDIVNKIVTELQNGNQRHLGTELADGFEAIHNVYIETK